MNEIDLPEYLQDDGLPWMKWVRYNGEECVATVNYQKSINCRRPIIDIFYCMTEAMNDRVIKSVNFDPTKFTKSLIDA